jgi:hypothetical protein
VGTANVGSRAPTCPPFILALRERGLTAIHSRRPRSGRGSYRFLDPEITFLTPYSEKKGHSPYILQSQRVGFQPSEF